MNGTTVDTAQQAAVKSLAQLSVPYAHLSKCLVIIGLELHGYMCAYPHTCAHF
jgi:hypothetical protein